MFYMALSMLSGCLNAEKKSTESRVESKVILVSKLYDDFRFRNWINYFDSSVVVRGMYNLSFDSVDYYLAQANGVIISGGNDIQPQYYGKEAEVDRCGAFDPRRDTLEIKLIDYALNHKIPLLGICRGEQLINVSQGGSLIIDIPSDWNDSTVIHRGDSGYVDHMVSIAKHSLLDSIMAVDSGMVKSFHHQAVENIAPGFVVTAYSKDSLPEAIELMDKSMHPFVLGVQWHPEKVTDFNNPLSKPIIERFLKEVYLNN